MTKNLATIVGLPFLIVDVVKNAMNIIPKAMYVDLMTVLMRTRARTIHPFSMKMIIYDVLLVNIKWMAVKVGGNSVVVIVISRHVKNRHLHNHTFTKIKLFGKNSLEKQTTLFFLILIFWNSGNTGITGLPRFASASSVTKKLKRLTGFTSVVVKFLIS